MGNKASFERHIDVSDLDRNFELEKKINSSLGEARCYRNKTAGPKLFEKEHTLNSHSSYDEFLSYVRANKELNHPNLLRVFGYNTQKEEAFCAEHFKISVFFESFAKDLSEDISTRHNDNHFFTEVELWLLLDSIASVGTYLQRNIRYHGDIRPSHIVITGDNAYKLVNKVLLPEAVHQNTSSFRILKHDDFKFHFLGPQAFSAAKNDPDRVTYDVYKNDVFALGMVVLEAACLGRVSGIYNYKKHEMSRQPIDEAFLKLRDLYSERLVKILSSMLSFNEGERPDFTSIEVTLSQYRSQIKANIVPLPSAALINDISSAYRPHETAKSPVYKTPSTLQVAPDQVEAELDRRIQEALTRSEANIAMNRNASASNIGQVSSTASPKRTYVVEASDHQPYQPNQPTSGHIDGGL